MPKLNLYIEQFFEGDALDFGGAVVDIIPLNVKDSIKEQLTNRLIPAGETTSVAAQTFNLPAGEYLIQARLPSGQVINQPVTLEAGKESDLAIRPESSPHEWLSWQSYIGDVPSREQRDRTAEQASTESSTGVEPEVQVTTPTGADDLTKIRGVGPKIAGQLNKRGIHRFEQIANLSEKEVGWLTKELTVVRRSIRRDAWVDQAADLTQSVDATTEVTPMINVEFNDPWEDSVLAPLGAEPELRYFIIEEGSAPNPVRFFHVLNLVLQANRSGPDLIDNNAFKLKSGSPDAGPEDLGMHGSWLNDGNIYRWSLRDNPWGIDLMQDQPLRRVYLIADDGVVQWVSTLPVPWHSARDSTPIGIDITINRDNPRKTSISVLPRDHTIAPLLGFLKSGNSRAAQAIVQSARDFLFEKILNPYAAAVGGYVLVNSLRWGGDRSAIDTDWFRWIENLTNWNPWLPDARILLAWLQMLTSPERLDEARDNLLGAANSGLPTFTGSFQLLIEGLKMFHDHADGQDNDVAVCVKELDLPAMRVDTRQVFTTIRLTPRPRST